MTWIDWSIVLAGCLLILWIGIYTQRYLSGVSSFLAGGRLAGRYMLSVAQGEAAMGLVSVIALFEVLYRSGVGLAFWGSIGTPLMLVLALTGFVVYRFRQTRAMTLAQFFELRYSRNFRVFAGMLAFTSGVIHYALFPGVAARFFIYYCGLPDAITWGPLLLPTFPVLMTAFLAVGVVVVFFGGQITIMVTDCVQGLLSYWAYAALVVFVLVTFGMTQISEAMLSRPPGQSFVNPFDLGKVSQFNVFYVMIGLFMATYGRMAWQGNQAYNASAKNPHEQKMASVLGNVRHGFTHVCVTLLLVGAFTYLNHPDFSGGAEVVQGQLEERIQLGTEASTEAIQSQMLVPMVLSHILPVGLMGVFAVLMVFLMVSTDSTMLHSWGSILIQDVVLPFRKKPFEPKHQILLLRLSVIGVAIFAGFFSYFYGQVTYLMMFFHLTAAVFIGGAGAVIIGGLYWKRGTTAAAWCALLTGSSLSLLGFVLQHNWRDGIYPWLSSNHAEILADGTRFFTFVSEMIPVIHWEVTPERFPISGAELGFFAALSASALYVMVSLLDPRGAFNLDRMLHRGIYDTKDEQVRIQNLPRQSRFANLKKNLIGIDEQYSRGDRVLAWSVFSWSMFNFGVFVLVLLINVIGGIWSGEGWFNYWRYWTLPLGIFYGTVTTIWFTWGGTRDLFRFFRSLRAAHADEHDDGRVIGHLNADEIALIEQARLDSETKIQQQGTGPEAK